MPRTAASASPVPSICPDEDTRVHTLSNGVRVLTIREQGSPSVCLSVFVRSGSRHEGHRDSGISHVVEHMAFKGTTRRDCQRINRDAERLGAEVNAHTDRDHTAFHMRGLARDAVTLLKQLADIVRHPTFPEDELERERQVILHEYTEVEDDPVATAFRLFDRCSFGRDPVARPVIGSRANIRRFSRDDLLDWVQRQYTGCNTIVAVAGGIDPEAVLAAAEAAFGRMPAGTPNVLGEPAWLGGMATRRHGGSSQVQLVLGWPGPSLQQPHAATQLAAAVLGEGMSSPLIDAIRERQALCYYAACSADVLDGHGAWVIEASTSPQQVVQLIDELVRQLQAVCAQVRAADLQRARHQLMVRALAALERPFQRLEAAAQDLYALGRVRGRHEWMDALQAATPAQVRRAAQQALAQPPALALVGATTSRALRGIDEGVLERLRVGG
ncbi:MAG: hypothetical protein RIQ53_734 [Pseudomonadota bacterium]|jgi:predicted Zn-dependent peptidase